jgi:hypothetical protein
MHDQTYRHRARKFAELILFKQEYKCWYCGELLDRGIGRAYAIHHIDHDKTNNIESNLVAMHYGCHTIMHNKEFSRQGGKKTKTYRRLGKTRRELHSARSLNTLFRHEEVINIPQAREVVPGVAYIKHSKYLDTYGFTLQEFSDHLGCSRERVRQLINKDSPRIGVAIDEMLRIRGLTRG